MNGVRRPIRDNLAALVSLVVALSAPGYNTWRNERTGWAEVYMIGDLAAVMPADGAIDALRQTTLAELRALR